jgi:hypothetical protein
MAKAKKTKKPTVKVQDLKAKADPKGGLTCAAGEHFKEATITVK